MNATAPTLFDGPLLEAADHARLSGQLALVKALMADGQWRTLAEIAAVVKGSEAGTSSRLRDLRKARFGGHTVERQRVAGGLWQYRVLGGSN